MRLTRSALCRQYERVNLVLAPAAAAFAAVPARVDDRAPAWSPDGRSNCLRSDLDDRAARCRQQWGEITTCSDAGGADWRAGVVAGRPQSRVAPDRRLRPSAEECDPSRGTGSPGCHAGQEPGSLSPPVPRLTERLRVGFAPAQRACVVVSARVRRPRPSGRSSPMAARRRESSRR